MTLHVPQSLSGLDHATFDAHFVRTWHPTFPWTKSSLPEESSITPADYVTWTKAQLAEVLKNDPRLRGYDFNRQAFTYVAFELARWSLQTVHLRQMEIDKLAEQLRRDFVRCLKESQLLTVDERSPLYGQGIVREQGSGVKSCTIPITSRFDRNLLLALAGGPPDDVHFSALRRVEEWLEKDPLGHLSKLDRSAVSVQQEEWRVQMWQHLKHVEVFAYDDEAVLPQDTREEMLNQSIDAMIYVMPTPIVSETTEREITEEVFRRRRTEELRTLPVPKLVSTLMGPGMVLKDTPSRESLVQAIVDREVRQVGKKLPDVGILEQPIGDQRTLDAFTKDSLHDSLGVLLEQPASPERDEKIRQRLVIPEYQMLVSAQKMLSFLLDHERKRPLITRLVDSPFEPENPSLSVLGQEDLSDDVAADIEQLTKSLLVAHAVLMRAYTAVGVNYVHRPIAVILDFILSAAAGRVNIRRQRSLI